MMGSVRVEEAVYTSWSRCCSVNHQLLEVTFLSLNFNGASVAESIPVTALSGKAGSCLNFNGICTLPRNDSCFSLLPSSDVSALLIALQLAPAYQKTFWCHFFITFGAGGCRRTCQCSICTF